MPGWLRRLVSRRLADRPHAEAERLVRKGRRSEEAGRLREAREYYRRAVAAAPGHAAAHLSLGIALDALGEADAAARAFEAALAIDAREPFANYNLGRLHCARGEPARAEPYLRAALAARREFPEAQVVLANVLEARGDLAQAAALLEAALELRPAYAGALRNYGNVLSRLERWSDAAQALQRALDADPSDADAHYWLGNAWVKLGKPEAALGAYRQATELRADFALAWCNLGNVLADRGSREEAVRCLNRAASLKPDYVDAYIGLGNVFAAADQLAEATQYFRKVLALDAGIAQAQLNLGIVLADQGLQDEALECFRAAIALRPESPEPRWALAMGHIPAVRTASQGLGEVRPLIAAAFDDLQAWFETHASPIAYRAVGISQPFWLAYQAECNRELLQRYGQLCARLMGDWQAGRGVAPVRERAPGPIRVGVVSRYLRHHSVWHAIVRGWFQELDASRFALSAFALDAYEDEETRYARARAARFEQGHIGLERWAEVIADARPDVLVFPEIGMDPMTLKLASLRLAPVQAASWGHPETSGLPTIDFYLSADRLEPEGAQENYSERLVTLPNLGCHVQGVATDAVAPDLARWGIEPDTPLLVSPGTPFKYAPENDWIFPEIAERLKRCRILFFIHRHQILSDRLQARLQAAFERRGLDFQRHVAFVPWQDKGPFCGLLERAHVYLDTIGFSGFNTALLAMQCGTPVVTVEGRFLRGRLASGILRHMGLDDWVATDAEEYVRLAVRAVQDGGFRESARRRIAERRGRLFADRAPIRALEEFLARAAG
ncbi:MAG: tetratricopeptide repeat protein [Burkholderiales bacterium]